MKAFWPFSILFLLLLAAPAPTAAASSDVELSIAVTPSSRDAYRAIVAEVGYNPMKVMSFKQGMMRAEVELILSIQAITLGGLNPRVTFTVVPNVGRETHEVAAGKAIMASQAYNRATFENPHYVDSVFRSSPVIRLGEFQKGFYAPIDHPVQKARSVNELNQYTGIIGVHWNQGAQTLVALGITNFIRAPRFECLPQMIQTGRADYIPLEFSNNEKMRITLDGVAFEPVPGLKFALLETRHLMVSRKHPEGQRVFEAMERGLAIMRKRGAITRAYRECGFFQPKTDSWTLLNRARLDALTAK